ncbi:MAG TPA: hypothetical protein VLH19_02530 [Patescibacteria group bacterium]|nr:hypothetical protein [Patescibacteria group bacterium]
MYRVLIPVVFCILLVLLITSQFKIRHINCTFEQTTCTQEQLRKLEGLQRRTILGSVKISLTPYIVHIEKQYPQTIWVKIENPSVLYSVRVAPNGEYRQIGDAGLVVEAPPQLKIEVIDQRFAPLHPGDRVSSPVISMYRSLSNISPGLRDMILRIEVKDDTEITIFSRDGRKAVVDTQDFGKELESLQSILSNSTIENRFTVIDLRFANPVLKQ